MGASVANFPASPAIPADATVFKFRSGATWLLLLALLLAISEAALLFIRAWSTPDPSTRLLQIPEGIFFALAAELNWRLIRRSRYRVAVSADGIWSIHGQTVKYVAWLDVVRVLANDTRQRLELIDRTGAIAIEVDYQLKNFERLRDFILAHTQDKAQFQNAGVSTFHHVWEIKLIYTIAGAFADFAAWQIHLQNGGHLPVLPIFVGAAAVFMILREPVSVTMNLNGVVINYLGFQGNIPFNSIAGITLSDRKYRWNVWAGVVITTAKGRRIRLTRFREGSVALYEALQSAWKQAAAAQGFALPVPAAPPAEAPAPSQNVLRPAARPSTAKRMGYATFIVIMLAAALVSTLSRKGLLPSIALRRLPAPLNLNHAGPIAPLGALKGEGRVYLVQIGKHTAPYSLDNFARWLHTKYALDVQVLPPVPAAPAAWDVKRRQLVAEQLEGQIKQQYPDLASNHDAYLIGFTDQRMYSTREMWAWEFTQRDRSRTAVISAYEMGDTAWQKNHLDRKGAVSRFQARLQRILLKDVAILYWHLPLNDDPTSLLHNPLNTDLPTEDIYQSDLDPASGASGEKLVDPCIFFTYSTKGGMKPLPGPLIRDCGNIQDPMEDESVEVFELVLRLGLLIDKHTDLYLPDTIPIEFQRAIRDGERGKLPFGISGTDNYDDFLASYDDDTHILVLHDDGSRDELTRYPRWLSMQSLVKWVGGPSEIASVQGEWGPTTGRVWFNEMAWHSFPFGHYDIRHFNGGVEAYLPCSGSTEYCSLIDYHDSQGRELKFLRDSTRHLRRLTSPNGKWVAVNSDTEGRITSISDDRSRTIAYTYDPNNRLIRVTYPSGAVYSYEYDDTQHMLTFNVSPDGHSAPSVVLRNEYQNGLLTKQTFAGGEAYSYSYDSSNPDTIHRVKVYAPGREVFDIEIGSDMSTVHKFGNHP